MSTSDSYIRADGSCAMDVTFRISDMDGKPLPMQEAIAILVALRGAEFSIGQSTGKDGYVYATFWTYTTPDNKKEES